MESNTGPLTPQNFTRENYERIAQIFRAFSDPTRLQLLQALRKGSRNVGQLVQELEMNQANVSKHLQILFDSKILGREKRGTATYYEVNDEFIYPLCKLVCEKINREESRSQEMVAFEGPDYSI
ncbi:metalloregulator ArsR/SmtB family transcription factor (plasmid) [Verrucomicrobiaceae bacterium 227]